MKHYLDQLGPKFIFIGDFNAHSPLFQSNCGNSNFTGRTLENIVLDHELCLVNPVVMSNSSRLRFGTGRRTGRMLVFTGNKQKGKG